MHLKRPRLQGTIILLRDFIYMMEDYNYELIKIVLSLFIFILGYSIKRDPVVLFLYATKGPKLPK